MRANVDFPESSTAHGDERVTLTRIASEYGIALSAAFAIASVMDQGGTAPGAGRDSKIPLATALVRRLRLIN